MALYWLLQQQEEAPATMANAATSVQYTVQTTVL